MDDTAVNTDFLSRQLHQLYPHVRNGQAARIIWQDAFTSDERRRLGGDLELAFENDGTIGMWLKVRPMSRARAIVEIARAIGQLFEGPYQRLSEQLGGRGVSRTAGTPEWDKERRELRFRNKTIRHVRHPQAAKNVVLVLDTFEEEGWPPRIDDPLPDGQDSQRLHATIRSLNTGLQRIVFSADGTGTGYMWSRRG